MPFRKLIPPFTLTELIILYFFFFFTDIFSANGAEKIICFLVMNGKSFITLFITDCQKVENQKIVKSGGKQWVEARKLCTIHKHN